MTFGTALAVIGALILPALVAVAAWRAIATARTPQGAVGWVVFLLSAPWFALPSYILFGQSKFRGYVVSRRNSQRVIEALDDFAESHAPSGAPDPSIPAFEKIAGMPAVGGNTMEILVDGTATFAAVFDAIDRAKTYILVQFYILRNDTIGRDFADRLKAAASRGVTVRVIYDGVGSYSLDRSYTDGLERAGIRVVDPGSARGPTSPLQINFRNHRKTVIVDGQIGFTGGHNVGDEYLGRDKSIGRWRDTHVAIEGPMVQQLQLAFAEDWHWATGETLDNSLRWTPQDADDDMTGLIVPTGPVDEMDSGSLLFLTAIIAARRRIWIASPYFVPDSIVLSALIQAGLRGVDVRLLVPDQIDHYLPWLAAFAYFDEVRDAGVTVYRYTDGFMHQKVFLADDGIAGIGTTNLDNRSFRLNFEAMAVFFDAVAAARVEEMLESDFAKARMMTERLSEQGLKLRVGAPLARLLAPLL
ncbi:cardiolipin synthase [Ovoidimarina sediminis]|uniref:cardiolipin synthase n=1 Tax=Ovoidimarina sediminis TaxID=3079856 RepID=UPI00290F6CE2|nr:cardiolipin synthase [Rhodophyticola sp. MJ-SS7]MDU8945392.1 cardiolipin synthase [Rhodophyticola sp. MJ-SS7]